MQIESSNIKKENTFSKSLKIEKENIICNDGFCSLPEQNDSQKVITNNMDLFDPI